LRVPACRSVRGHRRLPSKADSGDGSDVEPDRGSINGIPRWVKVFGVIAALAVLVFIISMAAAGG
jgi:hypothetical protein